MSGGVRAVVLDIGSVLEVVDDSVFPGPFQSRHGLDQDAVMTAADNLPGDAGLGELTEAEVRAHWQRELGLDEVAADELMRDFWTWYVGTLDQELFDNSGPGAREAEACWGFDAVTDDIVYSHEVGLRKPDPAIFALAAERLDVRPSEAVLLDDVEANVLGARASGWQAVLHEETTASIATIEALLSEASQAAY